MQRFRKFEFPAGKWEELKPFISKLDEEGNSYYNNEIVDVVVELGNLCLQWGTDAEGNTVCEVTDTNYAVDIVWHDEVLAAFVPYLVWPLPVGVSSMGYTLDTEYATAYCVANPTAEYCLPPVPTTLK
jgi:hypothetical protein